MFRQFQSARQPSLEIRAKLTLNLPLAHKTIPSIATTTVEWELL